MSLPTFPDMPECCSVEKSVSQILTSIAMEEMGLSHIINSEGEKLQYVLGTLPNGKALNPTIAEILETNESVKDTLGVISMNQAFLFGKMSSALNAYFKIRNSPDSNGGSDCPVKPCDPAGVMITTNKGGIYGNYLYLPQGAAAELYAIVMTSGESGVIWTHSGQDGFSVAVNGNAASVRISAAVGSSLTLKAVSTADSGKYDVKTIIVTEAGVRGTAIGGDGKLYADYGDNTFKEMNSNGVVSGPFICGDADRIPGTADDRSDVIVSESGVKYLGPNADGSYQKSGPDGLLGTEDDIFVWQADKNEPISPCNETKVPENVLVRNIWVQPLNAEVSRGGGLQFSATVYKSDDSVDPSGVTWEVRGAEPEGAASITDDGWLTAGLNAVKLTVAAVSKTNPAVFRIVEVRVKSDIQDIPAAVNGRTLSAEKTGDTADWIEIAQNGPYSLIVRKRYISIFNLAAQHDDPDFQRTRFGDDNNYLNSDVRRHINNWFTGAADGGADNLSREANLRFFTVRNTALEETGTGAAGPEGKNDGFSKPVEVSDPSGPDVAFALSYGESASFISNEYASGGGGYKSSGVIPSENFSKLHIPDGSFSYDKMWLRSPGSDSDMASSINHAGRLFQMNVNGLNENYALIYPALWVDSSIFD